MARNVGQSSATIVRAAPPRTSAQARRWASTSFADHSPAAGAVRSWAALNPLVSSAIRRGVSARSARVCPMVSGMRGTAVIPSEVLTATVEPAGRFGRRIYHTRPRGGPECGVATGRERSERARTGIFAKQYLMGTAPGVPSDLRYRRMIAEKMRVAQGVDAGCRAGPRIRSIWISCGHSSPSRGRGLRAPPRAARRFHRRPWSAPARSPCRAPTLSSWSAVASRTRSGGRAPDRSQGCGGAPRLGRRRPDHRPQPRGRRRLERLVR